MKLKKNLHKVKLQMKTLVEVLGKRASDLAELPTENEFLEHIVEETRSISTLDMKRTTRKDT